MSVFKTGARCDGCGLFSPDEQGRYVLRGRGGNISSHGRNCEHDFCDDCDAELYPSGACSRCGEMPDGATKEMLGARVKQLQSDIDHETQWWRAHRHLWAPGSTKQHDEIVADLKAKIADVERRLRS